MAKTLRGWINDLERNELLCRISDEVPIGQLATIIHENHQRATFFESVGGYDMPLVANTFSNREMMKLALNTNEENLMSELDRRIANPIAPVIVEHSPSQEIVITDEDVNLASFPLHLQHELDGAPYISASVFVARDPRRGVTNLGVYRMMYRTRNRTGIDVTAPHKLRYYYEQACEMRKPLEVAILLGLPTIDIMASVASAPFGVDEYYVLGGFRGEPVELVKCKSVDLLVPTNVEMVLEGHIEPGGWIQDEGPYGEFTGTYGAGLKGNPTVHIRTITRRTNAIFHSATHGGLRPGWTDVHVLFPLIELDLYNALRQAGIDVRKIRVLPASTCNWVVASIKPLAAGDAKTALTLMLSASKQAMPKFAVVVDEDVDIFDEEQLYWAMTWRTQPDVDVTILTGMKAVPLDPSLSSGPPVTTSKLGIDATIPVGRQRAGYERCCPMPSPGPATVPGRITFTELYKEMKEFFKENGPCYFRDLLLRFEGIDHQRILEAFGRLRERKLLGRIDDGRYILLDN